MAEGKFGPGRDFGEGLFTGGGESVRALEGINQIQGPQRPAMGQGVRGEVHGPPLTRPGGGL